MKKSAIIAAAIASLMAGSAAAENTVYGIAHVGIQQSDKDDNFKVVDGGSRLGFKGSEDLGNGMKAMYQYEVVVDIDEGAGIGGSARNSFVGLSGDFGTVLAGRHDTPAKMAFYAAGNEHLGDSVLDLNANYGFGENRVDDAIAYVAPAMGDLTIAVAIVPGEGDGSFDGSVDATTGPATGTGGGQGNGLTDGISVGVMYKAGAIKAGLGFLDASDSINGSTGADNTLMNLGGSYTMDDLTVGLQYQTSTAGTTDTTIFALVAAYAVDKNTFIASFGNNDNDTTDSSVMTLGMKHALSKKSTAYVGYSSVDAGSLTEDTNIAAGLFVKF